jgi:hypothetical protein
MGTWGAGIFSNDIASDVADAYRSSLADGDDGQTATDKVLEKFGSSLDDPDDGPPFWLALGAIQTRYGRLEPRVRDRALAIIEDGSDIARFSANASLQRARARALEDLRKRLLGPQRAPSRIRRPSQLACDWQAGEIIGFRRQSGEWLTLCVVNVVESEIGRYPQVCVLDTPFDRAHEATAETPVCTVRAQEFRGNAFYIIGLKKRDRNSERVQRTGRIVGSPQGVQRGKMSVPYVVWRFLDVYIDREIKIQEAQ